MILIKKDYYVKVFMGTDYEIGNPETIGHLKKVSEEIISDLPDDNSLEIAETSLYHDKLIYTLKEGIVQ